LHGGVGGSIPPASIRGAWTENARFKEEAGSEGRYARCVAVLGVDHVQVAAPRGCEDEARRFYGELLGLPELPKPEQLRLRGGVWFGVGPHQLHIGVEESFQPARKAHPALKVDAAALDQLASRLEAAGANVAWDDELPGVRRFYTEDPWGNRIELLA
jgi:catechol 2,3-dioxygenase-like lactoylglutathione lyase family enzyme